MNDTVSAATVSAAADRTPGGVRLAFLSPADVGRTGNGQTGGRQAGAGRTGAGATGAVQAAAGQAGSDRAGADAAGIGQVDIGRADIGQSNVGQSLEWSAAHIPGAVHTADAGPSLIVNFTTLAPDAYGWAPAPIPDQAYAGMDSMPVTVSGYATSIAGNPGPGIVGALSSS